MADTAVFSADGKWSISGTTATYKVNGTVVAKITGLASGLKIGTDGNAGKLGSGDTWAECVTVTAGDENTAGTIKLKQAALGTSAKTVLTLSNGGSYKLALDSVAALEIDNVKLSTSSGKATLTGDVTTGYLKTDDKTIVYSAAKTGVTLATVSGLVSSVPSDAVSQASGVITLKENAFNKKKVTISSGYGYKLGLATDADGYDADGSAAGTPKIGGVTQTAAWTVSGTTATYKQTKTAQYDLASDGKSVAYTAAKTATLATVKGLAKGLTATSGAISGIATVDTTPSDGVADAGSNITLDSTVLGTSKVTLVNGKGLDGTTSTYKLALATGTNVPATPTANTNIWTVSGTTATYKSVTTAGYTLTNDTTITYSKQTAGTTLATVKGLKKGLVANTYGLFADASTANAATDSTTAIVSSNAVGTAQTPATITVKSDALASTNVTLVPAIAGAYKLATDATAPQITPTWSVSGTTATLKGTIIAGWEKTSDTQITYTKATAAGKYATLATIKNLKTGLTATDGTDTVDGRTVEKDTIMGITLGTKDATGITTITLGSGVLGTKAISVSGTGYELALDSAEVAAGTITQSTATENNGAVTYTDIAAKDVWRLDGTTATYKSVTPAYYVYGEKTTSDNKKAIDKTKIVYTAEKDKENGTIATVKGLKSGLAAADNGIYATAAAAEAATAGTALVAITGSGTGADLANAIEIQLEAGALTTGDVTLTTGAKAGTNVYALKLGTVDEPELTLDTLTWATKAEAASGSTPASTTVIIRSAAKAGWTLNGDKQSITYAPASTATDVATITGLKAGLAANETRGIFATAAEATAATSAGTLITLGSTEDTKKQITLTADVVGEQDIAVTGSYGYEFATVENLVLVSTGTAPNAKDMWVLGSDSTAGTAEYKSMVPKYFKYDKPEGASSDDKKTLKYHAQEASTATGALKATLKGLAENLEVSGDGQSINADGTPVVTLATKAVTLTNGALASKTVSITGDGYTLVKGSGVIEPVDKFTLTYDASAGKATLMQGTSEGYKLNNDSTSLVYTDYIASDGASATKVAEITGLKTGLEEELVVNGTDGLGTGAYITHTEPSGGTKTITLAKEVLGTLSAGITLNNDSAYILAIKGGDIAQTTDTGWTVTSVAAPSTGGVSTTTATLYEHKTAGYAVASGSKAITYTAAGNTSTKLAEITGLAYGLSASTVDQQIEGITVDSNKNINLNTTDVLTASDLTLTNKDSNTYKLALQQDPTQDNFVPDPADTTNTFSIASGTLTYKVSTPNSYTVATDGLSIAFTAAFDDVTTITGLKSTLNRSESTAAIDGITLTAPVKSTTEGVDDTPGTFNIGKAVLGKKDITLTNDKDDDGKSIGDDYIIALGGDVTAQTVNPTVWNKTNKTTTATYTQTFAKGYTKTDDEHIVYASKNTKKTYATLTGLNKDVVANADGTINGITIALGASVTTASAGSNATVVSGDVITLSDPNLFTTTNITLGKTDNYYLAVAEGFGSASAAAHWSLAKGTAKVVTGMTEGWQIKETVKNGTTNYENKTIEYKKADETSKPEYTLATVTGLNSALELNDDGTIDGLEFDTTNHNITVSEAAVTTGTVAVAGTSYTLVMGDGIGLPEAEEPEWVVNKGTATYQYDVSEGWKFNSTETPTSMTYQAAKTEKTAVVLTTITGLNPALEAAGTDIAIVDDKYELSSDGTEYVGISSIEKGTIELSAKALEGTKTVKFKDKNSVYQFKLADDVYAEGVANTNLTEDQNADEWKDQDGWVTNGTTANYKTGYHKEHYKFGTDGSIAVVAATKGDDVATVKNIKKDSTITDQNGLITLTSANLDGKTVTLTSTVAGYALALDTTGISNGDIVESKYINKKWETKGNKANLTGTLTTGYKTSADGKSITYTTKNTSTTIATVTGIKNNVNITDCVNESTGEITLSKAQLDGKAVTLTNTANLGYTLKLGDDVAKTGIDATTIAWDTKGDTATLNGKVTTAGYTVAPDAQSIAYTAVTASNKVTTLATIKGINQSKDIAATLPDLLKTATNANSGKITLRNELLAQTTPANATVDGKNLFAFEFAADYSNKKVTGTTVSDKLTVTGSGVQVEGGKGNDIINFTGSDGGNTLVYASGDGDDVVVNFTDSDIIKSEKSVITGDNIKSVSYIDDKGTADTNDDVTVTDVLVTIGKNTIRLQNYTGSTLTIFDKSGTTTYESQATNPFWTTPTADSASNVLLADNNYSADAAALSDIVEPFKASYTSYDFEGGLDLVKKDSFAPAITYTGTDKK